MPDSSSQNQPQIYLIAPPRLDTNTFPDLLRRCVERTQVACLRVSGFNQEPSEQARMIDAVREVAYEQEIAVVIENQVTLAQKFGLDGVHLSDGSHSVSKARKALGADAIIGAWCGSSRHTGMTAAEISADYVTFGPVQSGGQDEAETAEDELFAWWSEMIEVPVVAEGGLTPSRVRSLSGVVDFFAIGSEIWDTTNPEGMLAELAAARC